MKVESSTLQFDHLVITNSDLLELSQIIEHACDSLSTTTEADRKMLQQAERWREAIETYRLNLYCQIARTDLVRHVLSPKIEQPTELLLPSRQAE